ncbi:hypothetical protein FRZ67_21645 [Panacibacter ginsenosidivorans]|uniref:Uncharacterized protein n=1 Tax=Panacibacter ginsenosidivorans TaxID=1813871 RepID=A0A5B8VFA0_9BACT|nr:hypothetical protein [Panacibacter ginsenosidivorans]QEC69775.1 hypothetical protein FRZ67_21645 [Panacibacter ginsenosidivorans]
MDNQLKLLISLYEEEKVQLQKLIHECLGETEYLLAHYHSQALYQLNGRLQTLKNIDDKLFDQKDFRQRRIDSLQKRIEVESSDYMKEHYVKDLQRANEELEKLNQIPKPATSSGNETLFDETLKKLVDKKIKNLKLILKKADNLFLGFRYSKKILKVTLPYVKQHTKKWILYDDNINSFKNLGFNLTESETKLILTLTGDKDEILNRLKLVLSKVVFEIFYFKEFDNESFIEFTDKASR